MRLLIFLSLFTQILYSNTLKLSISPEDTNIKINNTDYTKDLKSASLIKKFDDGEYKIEVCKKNYKCELKTIWLMGEDKELKFELQAIKAELLITSNNIDSIILVNKKQIEKNKIIEFKKNETIEIEEIKDYFKSNKMMLKIEKGNSYTINLPELKAITKKLKIKSIYKYKNTSIRLNGKEVYKGLDKSINTNYQKSLNAGNYDLHISAEGYHPFEKKINITDKDINLEYKLNKKTKNLEFGLGLSYLYDRLLGGYPQIDIIFKLKDKINFKLGILYVVNFSTDAEYYGLTLSSSYDLYKHQDLFTLYAGLDILFSKYINNNIDYLLNGLGINLGTNIKLLKDLFINLELNNRLHYMYNNDYYNISGKIGIIYSF